MQRSYTLLTLIVLAVPASADTVYLTNGGMLDGRVTYENGRIIVEQANIGFRASTVLP